MPPSSLCLFETSPSGRRESFSKREAFTADHCAKAPSQRGLAQRSCDWGSILQQSLFVWRYGIPLSSRLYLTQVLRARKGNVRVPLEMVLPEPYRHPSAVGDHRRHRGTRRALPLILTRKKGQRCISNAGLFSGLSPCVMNTHEERRKIITSGKQAEVCPL